MEMNEVEDQQIEFIIGRFPVHNKNQTFLPYNLYLQTQQHGVEKSIPLRLPCVRQGCTTSCYFQAQSMNTHKQKESCMICGNSSGPKIYLDIGLKNFINKHRKYIILTTPLNVLINPQTNQYSFPSKSIKNNLESTLSSFIARQLINQLKLHQSPLLHQHSLDCYKINKQLKKVFKPPLKQRPYFVYSFCKYHPLTQQQSTGNHIVLFIKGMQTPIRVRILTDEGKEICDSSTFLKHVKIVLLGNINTFIFCVPCKRTTEYYASNCNYHLEQSQRLLLVMHQKNWSDELPRFNGSLVADQINNSVFAIGGFDKLKNDSLDYISCFLNCKWQIQSQSLTLVVDIQKNHHLFANGSNSNNTAIFNSYFKQNPYNSKFAIINSSYLISSNPSNRLNQHNKESKYTFLSIGGVTRDQIFFSSNRFVNKPPGIRTILYDKSLDLNPIIHHTYDCKFHFQNNNYIVIELPHNKTQTQKQLRQLLIMGGKGLQKAENGQNRDKQVVILNNLNLQQAQIIKSDFQFGQFLMDNIDQNSSLLFDDQTKQYHVRTTIPFATPILLAEDAYAYCLIIEFNVSTGCLTYHPEVLYYSSQKDTVEFQKPQSLATNQLI